MNKRISFKVMAYITVIIVLVMTTNFVWDIRKQQQQMREQLIDQARVIADQMLSTRQFIAQQQDKINYDSQGRFEFKHLNPAAVGHGVAQIFNEKTPYQIKQTRMDYRDPSNAPDNFEKKILMKFKQNPNLEEYWSEADLGEKKVFRYLVPVEIKESCLQCHGQPKGQADIAGFEKEGYQLGDIGGAISIVVPMERYLAALRSNIYRDLGFILLLLGITLAVIYWVMHQVVTRPLASLRDAAREVGQGNLEVSGLPINAQGEIKELAGEFAYMANQLGDLYSNLEQRVSGRTKELAEANEKLQQQQNYLEQVNCQLERSNKLKSQFLAAMTHELRTPLTAIIAFTELTLTDTDLSNQARSNLRDIQEQGQSLLALINNLLDMAKLEAGYNQLNIVMVDLVDVLDYVASCLRPLAEKKGIELVWDVDVQLPIISGDEDKLQRAFLNLVGNAVKFSQQGGQILIKARYYQDIIEVKVKDNGIGIAQDQQGHIFEKFYQVDGSDARKYRGTGLGLALVKEWVSMHGGGIKLDSTPGQGSEFTLFLPVKGSERKDA